jgi:hypothetical protein
MDIQTANMLLLIAAPVVGFIIVKVSALFTTKNEIPVAKVPQSDDVGNGWDDPIFVCANNITPFVSSGMPVDALDFHVEEAE